MNISRMGDESSEGKKLPTEEAYDLMEPVDILSKIPKDYQEKLVSAVN